MSSQYMISYLYIISRHYPAHFMGNKIKSKGIKNLLKIKQLVSSTHFHNSVGKLFPSTELLSLPNYKT